MAIRSNFPAIKPTLLLDFANTKALDPRITFTRSTTATFYDGVTTAKAEENLLIRSQEFENGAGWVTVSATVTTNNSVAPDGTTTADTITASSGTGLFPRVSVATVSSTASVSHTASIYAKAGTHRYLQLTSAAGTPWHCNFDLLAGSGAVGSSSGCTGSIVDAGNGWYRCVVVFTPSTTDARVIFILVDSASAARTATWNPAGTETVLLWGAQLEQRSAVTAYTATTTQPITNYIPALQTATAGVARFDHNPITDESLGLLIEEQRTNLLTYSEDFSNAAWTKGGCSVSANAIVAPDGTLTGDRLVEDTTNGDHRAFQLSSFTSGTAYTFTVYAKQAGRSLLQLANTMAGGYIATFDLAAGTVSNTATGTATITNVGNGWYRCSVSNTSTFTGNSNNQVRLVNTGTNTSYTGDGWSGVFVWGAQVEVGAFPTSYIPTVAAQVTRNADVAYLPVTGWYAGSGEATIYAEINSLNNAVDGNTIWFGLYGSTALTGGDDRGLVLYANYQFLSRNPTNTLPSAVWQAGNSKIAMAMDGSGKYISKNGGTVISTSGAGLNYIIGATVFSLSGSVGSKACSTLKKIAYYPIRVTNAHLQGLTTV